RARRRADLPALRSVGGEAAPGRGPESRASVERLRELRAREALRDEYVRTYSGVSEIFAGVCTLAGLGDLADKVRPTRLRRVSPMRGQRSRRSRAGRADVKSAPPSRRSE